MRAQWLGSSTQYIPGEGGNRLGLRGKCLQRKKRAIRQQRPMRSLRWHLKRGRQGWLVPNQIRFTAHLCPFGYEIKNEFLTRRWNVAAPCAQRNIIPNYIKLKHYRVTQNKQGAAKHPGCPTAECRQQCSHEESDLGPASGLRTGSDSLENWLPTLTLHFLICKNKDIHSLYSAGLLWELDEKPHKMFNTVPDLKRALNKH